MSGIAGAESVRRWLVRAVLGACLPAMLVACGRSSDQLASGGIVGTGEAGVVEGKLVGAVLKASEVEFD